MFLDNTALPGDRWDHCLLAQRSLASPRMFRRLPLAVMLLSGSLVLGGCFASSPPPTTTTTFPKTGLAVEAPSRILYKACGSTRDVSSATFTTSFLHPALSNNYLSGTWKVGPGGSVGTIQTKGMGQASIISTPLTVYLKASAAFWTQLSASVSAHAKALAGTWVAVSISSPLFPAVAPVAALGSMSRFLAGCFNPPKLAGLGSVNGIPIIYLHVHGGSGTQALGIALKGDPLILSMTQFSGARTLSTTSIGAFNSAIAISAPTNATPIADLLK